MKLSRNEIESASVFFSLKPGIMWLYDKWRGYFCDSSTIIIIILITILGEAQIDSTGEHNRKLRWSHAHKSTLSLVRPRVESVILLYRSPFYVPSSHYFLNGSRRLIFQPCFQLWSWKKKKNTRDDIACSKSITPDDNKLSLAALKRRKVNSLSLSLSPLIVLLYESFIWGGKKNNRCKGTVCKGFYLLFFFSFVSSLHPPVNHWFFFSLKWLWIENLY